MSIRGRCAIVGIGETQYTRNSSQSELALALEASRKAIADAGLKLSDIDGILRFAVDGSPIFYVATNLGLQSLPFYGELGPAGGAGAGLVGMAAAAITAGLATNVLIYRGVNGRSGRRYGSGVVTQRGGAGVTAFTEPFGLLVPGQNSALQMRRHMHEHGTTEAQMGAVAVSFRKYANRNPRALMYQKQLTLEDYLTSRYIHEPLRLYDCCIEADGGCALVVTSSERARDLPNRPAYILAATQGFSIPSAGMRYLLQTGAHQVRERFFAQAGITAKDIDCAQIYDNFTSSVLVTLEGWGFCGVGESGPFVDNGGLDLDGRLPVNTSGGHLSEAYLQGMNHLVEGVRQLRGESTSQVKDCETALVDTSTGAVILQR